MSATERAAARPWSNEQWMTFLREIGVPEVTAWKIMVAIKDDEIRIIDILK